MNILIYDNEIGYLAISKCLINCNIEYNLIHLELGKLINKKIMEIEFEFAFIFLSAEDLYALKIIESDLIKKNIIIVSDIPINIYYNQINKSKIIGFLDRNEISYESIIELCNCIKAGNLFISNKNKNLLFCNNLKINNNVEEFDNYKNKLSIQEYAIFNMMIKGISTNEISKKLNLHKSSVSTYKKRIYNKFSVETFYELQTLLSIMKKKIEFRL
jgi:DNA-binding NarL/FixJ family response regulator